MKPWRKLKVQGVWVGMSSLEINRDSVYIIVRDWSKKMKEELTSEELAKWGTPLLLEHLKKKTSLQLNHKDPMLVATSAYKPNY